MNNLYKKSIAFSFIALALLALSSCEDVITIEPEISEPQLVIDAWIDNRNTSQKISLAQSQQYFDNNNPSYQSGATVTVQRGDGVTFDFIDPDQDGIYTWTPDGNEVIGDFGDSFTLSIDVDGENFTASTEMNRVPPIDSITQEFVDDDIFSDDGIYVEFFARDPAGTGDAYWIKSFKNDEYLGKAPQLNIAYDAGFDAGSALDGLIFIPPIREFINELNEEDSFTPWNPGEKVTVEIHSLSTDAFNFLEITRDQINNGSNGIFSLPLANTRSNITNNSGGLSPLGLFNVAAVSSLDKVIE